MKIRLIPFAAIAVMMASCSSEDVMEINPDPSGDALTFSIAVDRSRATETKLDNLGNFNVVAKGIHPHGGLYDNFLIGAENGGKTATRDGNSSIWKLADNVYWPTSMTSAVFWAYTFSQLSGETTTPIMPDGVSFGFDTDGATPRITGFSPVKADLTAHANAGYWNDGDAQTDMLVAFTQQNRSVSASYVDLNFEHALSQIEINAQSADKLDSDHRIVRIKGAWIVNTNDKAELSAGFELKEEDNDGEKIKVATASTGWENYSFKDNSKLSAFGSFYSTPLVLSNKQNSPKLLGSSLMIIPQTLTAWDKKAVSSNNGAYILLLCRVELQHDGVAHDGSANTDDVKIDANAKKHYHQQFPVNAENKFDESEYGFVCVPVGTTLAMGKKYVFTLNICGSKTGAGIYPPDIYDDFKSLVPVGHEFASGFGGDPVELKIVERAVKKAGDPVLDEPIQFSVKVSDWSADEDWTDGGVAL